MLTAISATYGMFSFYSVCPGGSDRVLSRLLRSSKHTLGVALTEAHEDKRTRTPVTVLVKAREVCARARLRLSHDIVAGRTLSLGY